MGLADPEAALAALRRYRSLLVADDSDLQEERRRKSAARRVGPQMGAPRRPARSEEGRRESATEISKMQPLIESIARELDPDGTELLRPQTRSPLGGLTWSTAIDGVDRLIGILEQRDHFQKILGPAGPTLVGSGLHPWVWNAVVGLWDDGHYEPAVHQAALAVELQTQLKVGHRDLHGKDLYAQAFSVKDATNRMPRLRFLQIDRSEQPDDWTSAHEGAMHLGMGCAQGIRNPQAHPSDGITEQEALEQLATLSVLARWVDECQVIDVAEDAEGH